MKEIYIINRLNENRTKDFTEIINKNKREFSTLFSPFAYLFSALTSVFLFIVFDVAYIMENKELLNVNLYIWIALTYYFFKKTIPFYQAYKFYIYERKIKKSLPALYAIYEHLFFIKYINNKEKFTSGFVLFLESIPTIKNEEISKLVKFKELAQ